MVVEAEPVADRLVTVSRLHGDAEVTPLDVRLDDRGRALGEDRTSQLPQGAHVYLAEVGAGRLVVANGATRFEFPRIETDPQRLRASAQLLGAIGAGVPGGVFR